MKAGMAEFSPKNGDHDAGAQTDPKKISYETMAESTALHRQAVDVPRLKGIDSKNRLQILL